jgi:hypothetical protein
MFRKQNLLYSCACACENWFRHRDDPVFSVTLLHAAPCSPSPLSFLP